MNGKQQRAVFGDAVPPPVKTKTDAGKLLADIDKFRKDSLAGEYYAPFNVNSKNYMDIPEETDAWCHLFAQYAEALSKLTARSEHAAAITGFDMLYEVLVALDEGQEIIFAEEAGSWMIPTDEKVWFRNYLTSLAATATPEEFLAKAVPMLQRDSGHSFASKVYASALAVAAPAQRELLQKEMKRLKVRVR